MELDTVFVLHRRPYKETSQLLDLFSLQQGRCSALHRTNRKNPSLQPFVPYQLQFSGKGDLKYTKAVEVLAAPFSLTGRRLYCGFYLNELMVRLTWKGEPNPELFSLYRDSLRALQESEHEEPVLRRFEFHLLAILGYSYQWQSDSSGQPIAPSGSYTFDPGLGFVASFDVGRQGLISGKDLLAIAADDWSQPSSWQVAKQVARLALQPLLGDKPLTSRTLFQQFKDAQS